MKQALWELLKTYWAQLNIIDMIIGGAIVYYAPPVVNFAKGLLPAAG
jgi:hypothetical protein